MSARQQTTGLIAAAGRGTRAGLPYPKTLFEVQGQPILLRIASALAPHIADLVVVASPQGAAPIGACLENYCVTARIALQDEPLGMGHAVLAGLQQVTTAHVMLTWGDIPFLQAETIAAMVAAHHAHGNDFTFATARTSSAYTLVSRDESGRVTGVVESREAGLTNPGPGEREIGLFVFRAEPVQAMLSQDLPGKFGKATGEHGFLYMIGHLAAAGCKVEAVPVATDLDLVSLNSLGDLKGHI